MTTETYSENNLAALADALSDPARVAAARREQQRRRDVEASNARDAALQSQKELQSIWTATEKRLTEALNEVRAAEAVVQQHQAVVRVADEAHRAAGRALANLHREISLVHGGSAVEMALVRLDRAISAHREKIELLEVSQWDLKYAADGVTVVWRSLKQAEASKLTPAKERLRALELAQKAVQALQNEKGLSPAAVRRTAVAILEPLGIPSEDLLEAPVAR